MSDDSASAPTAAADRQEMTVGFEILAQYVKDLSFENPQAPQSLRADAKPPEVSMNVDVRAVKIQDNVYECLLRFKVDAMSGEAPAFLVELVYGGLFRLSNAPADAVEPIILIECPRFLFPFARRILADATRDGGFPPFMLEPIDWANLYRQRKAQAASDGATASVN